LNEWNVGRDIRATSLDMALIAQMMCRMHATDVRVMNYYDAQPWSSYAGVFDAHKRTVTFAYYAFVYFNRLYRLGSCVRVCGDSADMLAAGNGKSGAVLLCNPSGKEQSVDLSWTGLPGTAKLHTLDADCKQTVHVLGSGNRVEFVLPAESAVLVTVE
jgi:hypothetical protein